MMKKYLIFNKSVLCRPLSFVDDKNNSKVIELSKEEATRYVEELNQINGEELFFYMEREEWMNRLQLSDFSDQMDIECRKIMDSPELKGIRESICKEIDKNINGFMIPFEVDNNEEYERKLKEKLAAFIREIDRPAFRKEEVLVEDVKSICKKVIDAFEAAKNGKAETAEKIVADILEEYKQYSFAVSELDQSYAFRGMAPFNDLRQNWVSKEEYEKMMEGELNFFRARAEEENDIVREVKDIIYLPYSKRCNAKDLRFSSKGKVCLYLGVTSYVCSKECRWNGKDNLYLASFKFNEKGKKKKILNLVVLQSLLNGMISIDEKISNHRELHNAMIRIFPLVIATMFTIRTSDEERAEKYGEKIKYEYLLSQVLMNTLQKVGIDGVAYLSRQGKDDFQYPQMVCLAIPITGTSEKDEYGELINNFIVTKPVKYNGIENSELYERRSYINEKYPMYLPQLCGGIKNCNAKVDYNGKTVFYQDTEFSKMDDYLINQLHEKFII